MFRIFPFTVCRLIIDSIQRSERKVESLYSDTCAILFCPGKDDIANMEVQVISLVMKIWGEYAGSLGNRDINIKKIGINI